MSSRSNGGGRPHAQRFDLDRAIETFRADGSAAQAARVEQRLRALLGPEAFMEPKGGLAPSIDASLAPGPELQAPPPAPSAVPGLKTSGFAWWTLLGLLSMAGVAAWTLSSSSGVPAVGTVAAAVGAPRPAPVPTLVPQALPAPSKPPSIEQVTAVPAEPTFVPAAPKPRRRRARTLPAPSLVAVQPLEQESELALLLRARTALRSWPHSDPRGALELVERHARAYPQGQFASEREVLAVEALLKLDRHAQAFQRGQRYLRRYPNAPYAALVRGRLEQMPRGARTTRVHMDEGLMVARCGQGLQQGEADDGRESRVVRARDRGLCVQSGERPRQQL